MNVEITKSNPGVVPMYNMKTGEIGVVRDTHYVGTVVKAYADSGKVTVIALDDSNHFWTGVPGGGGVSVEMLPRGSKINITVP
jgi:hypothetical protein